MKIPYEQIAAYLKGQLPLREKAEVEKWMNETPEHQRIFHSLEKEWSLLKDEAPFYKPDKEKIWGKIEKIIDRSYPTVLYTRKMFVKSISFAAMIALLLGVGISFILNQSLQAPIHFTAFAPLGEKTLLTLPDSSKVWLNSGSTLTYYIQSKQRVVSLRGEAFFDVSKDPRKPFIVQTGLVNVQVHGTSFNVSAYESDPNVEVSLERGSVSVLNQENGSLLARLRPNQMAQVSKTNLNCKVFADDPETTKLWTNNILKIYDNNIYEVVKKLERWYGVDIQLENAQLKSRYTFVVKTESLRELLDLLNKMTPIAYKIEGKEVDIRLK